MRLNYKYISLVIGVFVVVATAILVISARQQAQVESQAKLESAHQELKRLVDLYATRTQIYLTWRDQIKSKAFKESVQVDELSDDLLKQTLNANLVSKQDLDRFDQVQNLVSSALGNWLANPAAQKLKPQGLEKIEESINRSRALYHESATDALRLQKIDFGFTG